MPHRTKKDSKNNAPGGSRWHNFHFSGKLILCSVFFGLMLLLIGGIIMAIGMDRDDETKSGDYNDIQKKPPLSIVGPVVMGIGGFITCVGIIMCLVETRVCRNKATDASPLIVGSEEEDSGGNRATETLVKELDASPRSQRHHRKHRHGQNKKTGGKAVADAKTRKSAHMNISPTSTSSGPISINSASKSYLTSSETFMTPPSTLTQGAMQMNARDAENQTSTSLVTSFNNSGKSWNVSTDFQTPSTSFSDSPSLEHSQEINTIQEEPTDYSLETDVVEKQHEFLTPQNSDADKLAPCTITKHESSDEIPSFSNSSNIQESSNMQKLSQAEVPTDVEVVNQQAQNIPFMKQTTDTAAVSVKESETDSDILLKPQAECLHSSKQIHQLMTEKTSESLNEKEFYAASTDVQQDVEAKLNQDESDKINSSSNIEVVCDKISNDPND